MLKKILLGLFLSGGILFCMAQSAGKNQKPIIKQGFPLNSSTTTDELDRRIKMVSERIAFGEEPKLTEDFLLSCVTLDPQFPRRFTEFSGDQCGRYLSAFSRITVPGNPVDLKKLATKIILAQKPDGRFGSDKLDFSDPSRLEGLHMALLWGNGRLLTGLMDYYSFTKDPAALQSAIRLGNFLIKTAMSCTRTEVVERFKTKGAMGYICFTQITDGLVKLFEQTSDKSYLECAATIYPLLPPLGNQHSHGFLNTLLGIMRLYNVTREPCHLKYVEEAYKTVTDAPDFLISGGVPEFFDAAGTKPGSRDEGCSEADFIMVSIELWKATGRMEYLERAEFCLYNELMYNQFDSGDFGSHPIEKNFGFSVATSQGRCWWCCDYHGLQAMLEAKNIIITSVDRQKRVNLYAQKIYKDDDIAFSLSKKDNSNTIFTLQIDSAGTKTIGIALRVPDWASRLNVQLNGVNVNAAPENGYLILNRSWATGDQVTIGLGYRLTFTSLARQTFTTDQLQARTGKAAIQYGPYLLCADDGFSTSFLAEPSGRNVIYIPSELVTGTKINPARIPLKSNMKEAYLELNYRHEGFYPTGKVILRPISELAYGQQANVQLWFSLEKQ